MDEQLEANRYPEISHWNYRVIRKTYEINGEIWEKFAIHEVYYENGEPCSWSADSVSAGGDSVEELKQDLEWQLEALKAPVINYEELDPGTTEEGNQNN